MSDVRLCCECDSDAFPEDNSEAFVNLCEWRDRLLQRFTTPEDRLCAIFLGRDEPTVAISLNGELIASDEVMELKAGPDGWVTFFTSESDPETMCHRCGEPLMLLVTFGDVTFSAMPELAVAS